MVFARDVMFDIYDPEDITAEMIEQEVRKNEKKGIKMKYETAKEALKDNPNLSIECFKSSPDFAQNKELRKKLGL